ncbi:MAG: molybdopterin-dependent oxidoreductase, partial [Acidobacteriota bacterium]
EFLLINHPLDCPICDKAGECPLQDYSFNYGSVDSRYGEFKRTYPGMDRTAIGPHVIQNMNRCIHCTRCIRFTAEITGTSELAFFKRGASTEVGVFPGTPLDNWMSACVTDICPTGALTPREFRFESRVWNLGSTESVCNGCDVGCNLFIGHRNGQVYRYRPRVNPEVNDHWLCDYGRFSYEQYETDRVVVPKVRTDDDYLGISTWEEALDSIEKAFRGAARVAAIASPQMTSEEAWMAKALFEKAGATIGLMVDPIGPIKMKSRTEWIIGEQGAPNFRGVAAVLSETDAHPLDTDYSGVDVLYICDARASDRMSDPAVVANLRKAKFLIVHSWDATHPLTEVADVLIPGTILAEKEGTFTNLQGKVQRIHQAFPPKGQAETDLEALRRVGARLFPAADEFRSADAMDVFESLRAEEVPA